jgi:nicotinate-nucleotide adenylyltransferase
MGRSGLISSGMRVGLLGGSFNPAHEGHLHVSRMCRRALSLDRIWWLVSPQNPLKSERDMASLATRLAAARRLAAADPRIHVTDIETRLGTRHSIDTLRALKRRYPGIRFVWLMGADNMLQLPHWKNWRSLLNEVPVAVYPRPGFSLRARSSLAARSIHYAIYENSDAPLLAELHPPALVFLEGKENNQSATALRAKSPVQGK